MTGPAFPACDVCGRRAMYGRRDGKPPRCGYHDGMVVVPSEVTVSVPNPRRFEALFAARERRRASQAARRDALKAAGKCTRCGEREPAPERGWCEACLQWGREYQKDISQTHRVLPGDRRASPKGSKETR